MKPEWVTINRKLDPWRQPMAIECEKCGAVCANEKAWAKHVEWHEQGDLLAKRDEARAAAVDLAKKVATLRTAMFEIRQHTAPSGIDRGDSAVEAIATAALEETKGVWR